MWFAASAVAGTAHLAPVGSDVGLDGTTGGPVVIQSRDAACSKGAMSVACLRTARGAAAHRKS